MMFAVLLAACSTMPTLDGAIEDRVDRIEFNRMYDDQGREVLSQIVFWDFNKEVGRFDVVAWRLWKQVDSHVVKLQHVNEYELLWHDGNQLRRVRAKQYDESWTQHDPEMHNRQFLMKEHRRELTRPADHFESRETDDSPSAEDLTEP